MKCKGLSLSFFFFFLLAIFCIPLLYSEIVINEVCYDPTGADDYHEWIEFYNNGDSDVNMEDWLLYSGGSEFTLTYIFPSFELRPHHYLLLAEDDCPNAHIFANLTLQNGGSETDGIRLVSPDSSYTDTILYDSPNSNLLPDDIHEIGTALCPDVSEGHSLARRHDGFDTNTALDWFDCFLPTPGGANVIPVDLAFGTPILRVSGLDVKIITPIHNLSTADVYNSHENLEVKLDNKPYSTLILPDIQPMDSITIDITVNCSTSCAHEISLYLNVIHDMNFVDNLWITSIFLGKIPIGLNEILYYPSPDNQEWIELYNCGNADISLHEVHLQDVAGNRVTFDLDIPAQGYKVLCTDSLDFVHKYPDCPLQAIEKLSRWVTLNNDQETIWLLDDSGKTIDSLHYVGSAQAYDRSLERKDPNSSHSVWDICQTEEGGTPGRVNSNFNLVTNTAINFVKLYESEGSLMHEVHLLCEEPITDVYLTCRQFDDDSGNDLLVGEWLISLPADSIFTFSSALPETGYHAYRYTTSDTTDPGANSFWAFYNKDFIPFTVNEIMYDPLTGYPEWLEIRKNIDLPAYPELTIHISADSVTWQPDDAQFTILVHDPEDGENLCAQFQCVPPSIIFGLPSLNNAGESIFVSDSFGNIWEVFTYDPHWSPDKGKSIERIQPMLLTGKDNCFTLRRNPGNGEQSPCSTYARFNNRPY